MSTLTRRVFCSLAILFGYHWLSKISLPFVRDLSAFVPEPLGQSLILALGLGPFLGSFLLVELYGLLTPWGRRLRRGGTLGRRRMNELALRLGLLTAAMQATGMVIGLEGVRAMDGAPLLTSGSGWGPRLVLIGTLMAGAFLTFFVCQALTRYGLGNGFCQLLMYQALGFVLWPLHNRSDGWNWAPASEDVLPELVLWFSLVATLGALLHRMERPRVLDSSSEDPDDATEHLEDSTEPLPLMDRWMERLPIHPQGIVPVGWASALLSMFYLYVEFPPMPGSLPETWINPYLATTTFFVYALTVPLLSWLALQLFSTRPRVEANLPSTVSLPDDYEERLRRRFRLSVVFWTLLFFTGYLLFTLRSPEWLFPPSSFAVAGLWFLAFDLWDEWRFRSQHRAERVLELDNVHLATYLELRLHEEGIPCLLQGYRYRSLFFFLAPLYKISLMVPAEQRGAAEALVEGLDVEVV